MRGPRFGKLHIACGDFLKPPLAHYAAAPFPTRPASLGSRGGPMEQRSLLPFPQSLGRRGRAPSGKRVGGAFARGDKIIISNLPSIIRTAVLVRLLRYHVLRPKSRVAADIFFAFFCKCAGKTDRPSPAVAHPPGGGAGLQRFYTFPVDGPLRREYDGKNVFGGKAAMKKKTTFGLLGLAAAGVSSTIIM